MGTSCCDVRGWDPLLELTAQKPRLDQLGFPRGAKCIRPVSNLLSILLLVFCPFLFYPFQRRLDAD